MTHIGEPTEAPEVLPARGPPQAEMEFETGLAARREIGTWIRFYNRERPHSSHDDDKTPLGVYNDGMAA